MDESLNIRVLAMPFWRFAVVPTSGGAADLPGIPFYREAEARSWFAEAWATVPGTKPILVRRRWLQWWKYDIVALAPTDEARTAQS